MDIQNVKYDVVAEQHIIASILYDPNIHLSIADKVKSDFFYDIRNKIIFDLAIKEENINPEKLIELIEKEDNFQTISKEYFLEVSSINPYTANINFYIDRLVDSFIRRKINDIAAKTTEAIRNNESIDDIVNTMEQDIANVMNNKVTDSVREMKDMVPDFISYIETISQNKSDLLGVPSGFSDLDQLTNGWKGGELIILAARPSVGKTAFALNLVMKAANKDNGVAFFSLEMNETSVMQRILCSETNISSSTMAKANLNSNQWSQLTSIGHAVQLKPVHIDDTAGITINEIRVKARRLKKEKNIQMIVIDYLQLITTTMKTDNRQQEVSEISRQLKALARELDIPVIALSQLSRKVEERHDKRPMLSDIRESGSIEQDADIIMFLYREDYYDREETNNIIEVIVAKNRQGATGNVELLFDKKHSKFAPLAKM